MTSPSQSPSEFKIEEATRAGVRELIGFFGMSSGGKTRSALILARGIVGPSGRIGVIDTENKRASMFADLPPGPACPGKYKVINLDAPFSPHRYIGALKTLESAVDIVVVDSLSHEWAGEGGVQEMHEEAIDRMAKEDKDDYKARDRLNWPAWKKPKEEHKALIYYILRYPLPLIVCLRGKTLTKMEKNAEGKNVVVTAPYPVPDFDQRFIYEMLIAGEVYRDVEQEKSGLLRITKISREEIRACLPKPGEQITTEHGAKLVAWCRGSTAPAVDDKKKLLGEIREVTAPIHGWNKSMGTAGWETCKTKLQQFLWDESILSPDQFLGDLPAEVLKDVLTKTRAKLQSKSQTLL